MTRILLCSTAHAETELYNANKLQACPLHVYPNPMGHRLPPLCLPSSPPESNEALLPSMLRTMTLMAARALVLRKRAHPGTQPSSATAIRVNCTCKVCVFRGSSIPLLKPLVHNPCSQLRYLDKQQPFPPPPARLQVVCVYPLIAQHGTSDLVQVAQGSPTDSGRTSKTMLCKLPTLFVCDCWWFACGWKECVFATNMHILTDDSIPIPPSTLPAFPLQPRHVPSCCQGVPSAPQLRLSISVHAPRHP